MPVVIEVYDPASGAPLYWKGVLAGVVFDSVDDSLTEQNGWDRVRMTPAAFNAWERRVLGSLADTKNFWLS